MHIAITIIKKKKKKGTFTKKTLINGRQTSLLYTLTDQGAHACIIN